MKVTKNDEPKSTNPRPVGPPVRGEGAAPITGAQARVNQEAAFDKTFAVAVTPGTTPMAVQPGSDAVSSGAAVAQAMHVLSQLETQFLQSPPSGPIADGFATAIPDAKTPVVRVEGGDVPLPVTMAPGLLTKVLPALRMTTNATTPQPTTTQQPNEPDRPIVDSRSDLGRAVRAATDKAWDKITAAIPTPANPAFTQVFTTLQKPDAQRIISELKPIALRLSDPKAPKKPTDQEKKKIDAGFSNLASLFGPECDVVALVTIVLMECHRDKGQDVRELIKEIQADNARKAQMRTEIRSYKQAMAKMQTDVQTAYQEALRRGDIDPKMSADEFAAKVTVAFPSSANKDGTFPDCQILSPPPDYYSQSAGGDRLTAAPTGARMGAGLRQTAADQQVEAAKAEVTNAQQAVDAANTELEQLGDRGEEWQMWKQKKFDEIDGRTGPVAGSDPPTTWDAPGQKDMAKKTEAITFANDMTDEKFGPTEAKVAAANERLANAQTTLKTAQDQAAAARQQAQADAETAQANADKASASAAKARAEADLAVAQAQADAARAQQEAAATKAAADAKAQADAQRRANFPPKLENANLPVGMRMGSLDEMKEFIGGLQDKLDSLGDVSMEKQMRLQMYMDAFAQTASMISNVQKKASETQGQIIQNMK